MIICGVVWILGVVILEQLVLPQPYITTWFGMTPIKVLRDFFIWQPFTSIFVHSPNPFHILFNMLLLYWLGSELERHWGSRFFGLYFFVSGIGAAILYTALLSIYALATGRAESLFVPVIGASGALFGLLLAYGIIFG
jgi:membrane associated rhomboid family serine protease